MWTLIEWQRHLKIFRVSLGLYLTVHFLHLIPWGPEVFGRNGVLSIPSLNGTYLLFPNLLNLLSHSGALVQFFIFISAIAAFLLAIGKWVPWVSAWLWYSWACLFNSDNLILNPSLPYIGWLLLALIYMSLKPQKIHREIYTAAWLLLGLGYFVSGWAKLISPSWQDGTALIKILNNPLARDYFFRDFCASLPPILWKILTWLTVALELLFLPLSFFQTYRKWIWSGMVCLHFGILFVVSFADLTFAMLIVHLFTFDPNWIRKRETK
jgi:hypothetical protein